jgi:hypothetical protein
MDARMWAQLGPLSHYQYEKAVLPKNLKFQPSADTYLTLPPLGMPIAIEVDENKLPTWRTLGSWQLIAEQEGANGRSQSCGS